MRHTTRTRAPFHRRGASSSAVTVFGGGGDGSGKRLFGAPRVEATDGAVDSLRSLHAGGKALPARMRARMETVFDADLSTVRVHEGPHVRQLGAAALTSGEHIHFAPGRFRPESADGRAILGHELAHVMQQRAGRVAAAARLNGLPANNERHLEAEAERLGNAAAAARSASTDRQPAVASAGGSTAVRTAPAPPGPIQRLCVDDFKETPVPRLDPGTLRGDGDSVKKSGSGQTGVYFVRQDEDCVVVKFVDEDSAYRSATADAILRETTDLRTADSVAFTAPDSVRAQIGSDILAWKSRMPRRIRRMRRRLAGDAAVGGARGDPRTNARLISDVDNDTAMATHPTVIVMEMLGGRTGDDLAEQAPDELLTNLARPSVQMDLATLLVWDALLANRDRVQRGPDVSGASPWSLANIGNLLFSTDGTRLQALDNDATLKSIANFATSTTLEMLEWLQGTGLVSAIDGLFGAIIHYCPPSQQARINSDLVGQVGQGIRAGIRRCVPIAMKQVSEKASKKKQNVGQILQNVPANADGNFDKLDLDTYEYRRAFLKRLVRGQNKADARAGAKKKVFG